MADAAVAQDEDTTATSGEVDPQDVADAQADNAQTSTTDRGRARAEAELNQFDAINAGKDPGQASLIAQYGLNAQQVRQILERARGTLQQNAPQMINLAAAQRMSNPGGWGQLYAGTMGAASDEQQKIQQQLAGYDLDMTQANKGSLDAQLKLLTQRYADQAKIAPAAMRVEGLPSQPAAKPVPGEVGQMEALAEEKGLVKGTPEYDAFVSRIIPKLTHVPTDPTQAAAMITPDAKELAYQYFKQNNALPIGFSRNPTMTATMLNYVAQRAAQEGETEVSMLANNQSNKAGQSVLTDFESPKGKAGGQLNAINTAVFHSQALLPLVDALNNGDITLINQAKLAFKNATGQEAPGNYEMLKNFLGGELGRATIPGQGGESERATLIGPLMAAKGPDALKGAIQTAATALAGKTEAYRTQWDQATHGTHGSFDQFLHPTTKKVLGIQDTPGPAAASAGKVMPSGPKMDAYAAAHFGGDAGKAQAFLATQGYK